VLAKQVAAQVAMFRSEFSTTVSLSFSAWRIMESTTKRRFSWWIPQGVTGSKGGNPWSFGAAGDDGKYV